MQPETAAAVAAAAAAAAPAASTEEELLQPPPAVLQLPAATLRPTTRRGTRRAARTATDIFEPWAAASSAAASLHQMVPADIELPVGSWEPVGSAFWQSDLQTMWLLGGGSPLSPMTIAHGSPMTSPPAAMSPQNVAELLRDAAPDHYED